MGEVIQTIEITPEFRAMCHAQTLWTAVDSAQRAVKRDPSKALELCNAYLDVACMCELSKSSTRNNAQKALPMKYFNLALKWEARANDNG